MTVGQSRTIGVSNRFSDPDGDRLTYSASSSAPNFVRASISGSTLTITAVQAFTTGAARITVTARDPSGLTAEISFDVSGATGGNRSPVVRGGISDVSNMTVGQSRTIGVSNRFSDPDGDRLTYSASSSAPNFVRASISGSTLTITAVQAFTTGAARITVTARDPSGLTAEISFDVSGATGGNRSPVVRGGISDVSNMTVGQSRTIGVSNRFSDPDGDRLTYSASSSAPNFVRASISGSTLTITAVQAFTTGAARITVTARDPSGLTAEISFDVSGATGGNRSPVVRGGISDVSNMTVGQSRTIGVSNRFSDPDGDRLTYSASSSAPNFVRASISGSTLTITAVQAFTTGAARITVTATDPGGLTASTTFAVRATVTAAPRRQWGYYAIFPSNCTGNGRYGLSYNSGYPDQASANDALRSVCNSRGRCPTGDTFQNTCVGVAVWDGCGYAVRFASSAASARNSASAACRSDRGTNCQSAARCAGNP